MISDIQSALNLTCDVQVTHDDARLPSSYAVSELAAASMGAVAAAVSQVTSDLGLEPSPPGAEVDQRLASLWFGFSIAPIDWELPPVWDAIAGDYAARDGWIKLHTNAPHHRAAALSVLGVPAERGKVAKAVAGWDADDLETTIVEAGGVAAAMRSADEWSVHAQGKSVAAEPLIHWREARPVKLRDFPATRERPLNGLRVLDLTRVLAGPVATRTLAGFGAQVLRIDPPGWDEANVVPDITLGKRCATLDLKNASDRKTLETLLAGADVLIHGYRADALERLGLGDDARRAIAPNLIDVALNAYGWTGPWASRRGYDSLVQMSSGVADAGMRWAGADKPAPLPVQALDHATGYLMAAAAIRALSAAVVTCKTQAARLSLARTAELLKASPQTAPGTMTLAPQADDFAQTREQTPWGAARRLAPAITVDGAPMRWARGPCKLGTHNPVWS